MRSHASNSRGFKAWDNHGAQNSNIRRVVYPSPHGHLEALNIQRPLCRGKVGRVRSSPDHATLWSMRACKGRPPITIQVQIGVLDGFQIYPPFFRFGQIGRHQMDLKRNKVSLEQERYFNCSLRLSIRQLESSNLESIQHNRKKGSLCAVPYIIALFVTLHHTQRMLTLTWMKVEYTLNREYGRASNYDDR